MLFDPHFHNEDAAYRFIEKRLWPDGLVCPHCRTTGRKIGKLQGETTRRGLYKCYRCRRPFTVKIGTIFESSHVELHLWLQAIYLFACRGRGITVRELEGTLGVARKTAWMLTRRIREAIARDDGSPDSMGDHSSAGAGAIPVAPETTGSVRQARSVAPSAEAEQTSAAAPSPVSVPTYRTRRVKDVKPDPRQGDLFKR